MSDNDFHANFCRMKYGEQRCTCGWSEPESAMSDSKGLVERLRAKAAKGGIIPIHDVTIEEAADELESACNLLRTFIATSNPKFMGAHMQRASEFIKRCSRPETLSPDGGKDIPL